VRRLFGAVTLVTAFALPVGAQVIPGFPGGRNVGQIQPVKRDTLKDTTNKIRWPAPDSITARLLTRPGYTVTRYLGDTAFFNAQTHALDLLAAKKKLAVVDRDSEIVVSDSGIYYTETNRKVVTGGKYRLTPPPSSGQADIKGVGRVDYDLANRSARITRARLPVNNGQMWYMDVALARVLLDTGSKASPTVFARGGSATSCDDSIPDYRFEFKEAKRTSNNTLVARPALLYIKDIPVLWLPFIFSDTRSGRHSGLLPPMFGFGDIVD